VDQQINNKSQSYNDSNIEELISSQSTGISIDIVSWLLKFLRYWYLFVIISVIALSLAYVKNKSWTPTYKTATTVLIQDARTSTSRNDLSGGFQGLGMGGVRSAHINQMIMIKSFDFISRVVDSLDVNYDIYEKHRFKSTNLYKRSQITIKSTYVANRAYGKEFLIKGLSDSTFSISYAGINHSYMDQLLRKGYLPSEPFEMVANYDKPFQHSFFFLTVSKSDFFRSPDYEVYVKFMSKPSLVGNYQARLNTRLLQEASSVVEVSITGKVEQRDVDFLNLLNREFAHQNLDYKNSSAERAIEYLDRQLAIIRDSIDSSEQKLNTFQATTGMYTQNLSTTKSQQLISLEEDETELNLNKQYMSLLEDELNKDGFLTDPSATGISNAPLSALVAQYNNLLKDTRELGPLNTIKISNERRIEELTTQIKGMVQTLKDSYNLTNEDLQNRLSKARGQLASSSKHERDLLTHTRDFNLNNSYYNIILQRRLENQLQKASNSPDNTVIDDPRVMGIVNNDEKKNNYILFLSIGLLLPFIFVSCKEILFKYSIQTRDELERISKLPVLGTIEHSKRKDFMVVKNFPRSSFAEGFRNLRSRMEFMAKKEKPVSMLVTSTEPKDGKTFIAINLSSIYGMANKRVIVVDFDLRRPMMTKSLNFENKKGLSNYLISQVSLEDVIYKHPELEVDIIPAGVTPPNPSELIRSERTKELLEILYQKYDYVILDCSPVGLVSDAYFLARQVDVVLYVVKNEKTNRNFFRYTIKELLDDNISNIALIYNDVNIQSGYYGSRRYYGKSAYYHKHGFYYNNEEKS
jgi:capsular exopolysaccharide family